MTDTSFLYELHSSSTDHRNSLLNNYLRKLLSEFLELTSPDEISETTLFGDLGTSSLQAVEFKTIIEDRLGHKLRTSLLFEHPRVDLLVDYLLSDILASKDGQQEVVAENIAYHVPVTSASPIAIVGMQGIFAGAGNTDELWEKTIAGELAIFANSEMESTYHYGRIDAPDHHAAIQALGITATAYASMDRQQRCIYHLIADTLSHYHISLVDLSKRKTGVFIAAQQMHNEAADIAHNFHFDAGVAYQVPLPNKISFQLNLRGPSEIINTFCTSSYVALHRAMQSIRSGECEQAIVGAISLINAEEFYYAARAGLYDNLLSSTNSTSSFSTTADGFTKSEGGGIMIIKPLSLAQEDKNRVLALVRGSHVYHGGRSFAIDTPNAGGIRETIRSCIKQSGLEVSSIDYIEAHGIASHLADAMELSAVSDTYRQLSNNKDKKWHVSTVKPVIGHPEVASGMAALLKVVKAITHQTLPGIPGMKVINTELATDHALILGSENIPWTTGSQYPRRAALNSYAIGGVNAHVILEEYLAGEAYADSAGQLQYNNVSVPDEEIYLTAQELNLFRGIVQDVFGDIPLQLAPNAAPIFFAFDSIKMGQFVRRLNGVFEVNIRMGQALCAENFNDIIALIRRAPAVARSGDWESSTSLSLQDEYPISEIQKGLWYINKTATSSSGFNVPLLFKSVSALQQESLLYALQAILETNPMLRVRFVLEEGTEEIRQFIRPVTDYLVIYEKEAANEEDKSRLCYDLLRQPFDLEQDVLIRMYIINCKDQPAFELLIIVHHIIIDGMSAMLFANNFWRSYQQHLSGRVSESTAVVEDMIFIDFVKWEQNYLSSLQSMEDLNWWKSHLADLPTTIHLPYDHALKSGYTAVGIGCEFITLSGEGLTALKHTASLLNVNLSTLLLAIFNVFLSKITGEELIAVTTPVEGRPLTLHEQHIGCFINLIVTKNYIQHEASFDVFLQNVKKQFVASLDHGFYPFSKLLPTLGLTNPNEQPLPVSFTYQNIFDELEIQGDALAGIEMQFHVYQETEDNYTFEVYDFRDRLQLNIKYKRSLFEQDTIIRHVGYINKLIQDIVADPYKAIKDYLILPDQERELLVEVFNATDSLYPQEQCVHELITQQMLAFPGQTALLFRDTAISYGEMYQRSLHLAAYLQRQGVGPDVLVGICIERSAEMIIAIFATLLSGGAYLPIDPSYLSAGDRVAGMLGDAKVRVVLTSAGLYGQLSALVGESGVLVTDAVRLSVAEGDVPEIKREVRPEHLAYVLYTSGSTGKPKGVMITHQSLTNLSYHMIKAYGISSHDKVLQFASIGFDMSVEEIFPYLLAGATVVIREEQDLQVDYFHQLVTTRQVTILNIPPVFFNVLADLPAAQQQSLFSCLRLISFGGEAIPEVTLKAAQLTGVRLFNAYGPTEYTVNATISELTGRENVTIGRPISNTQVYVLGKDMQPVPFGVAGELYIAGHGIARGYLNQDELTLQRFVPHFSGMGRMYKTGDVVSWQQDGELVYIGRADSQIKLRGFRIEPGEIENVLNAYPSIIQSIVVLQADMRGSVLVAYYLADEELNASEIKAYASVHLPEYMIPAVFVFLDEIPVTSSGKTDRRLMQSWKASVVRQSPYLAPRNDLETALVKIWEEVLNIQPIGVLDHFFELGGHSLSCIQVIGKTMGRFKHIQIQVQDMIRHPTIDALCTAIVSHQERGDGITPNPYIIKLRPGSGTEIGFIIPGMPGLADGYFNLAAHLPGEDPIYGLQMRGFMGEEPLDSVQRMAAHNIEMIHNLCPGERKINLYTHSYGGVVVYEMLRQLRDTALNINKILLIDCATTIAEEGVNKDSIYLFCDAIIAYFGIDAKSFFQKLHPIFYKPRETWKDQVVRLIYESDMRANKNVFMNLMNFIDKSISVRYTMNERLPYDVTVIEADKKMYTLVPAKPWSAYFEHTKVIRSDSDHLSIINWPYSSDWIRQL